LNNNFKQRHKIASNEQLWIGCIVLSVTTGACHSNHRHIGEDIGAKVSFTPPQLKPACEAVIEWVEQHDHGEAYLKSDKSVDRGVIIGLFEQMALLDVNEANSYDTYLKSCGNLNAFTWKPNKDSSNQNRVQKHVYESNHGDISGGTYVIRVVDFEVHGSTKPNLIRMRTVNDEIET
jgi:hypothetical protein